MTKMFATLATRRGVWPPLDELDGMREKSGDGGGDEREVMVVEKIRERRGTGDNGEMAGEVCLRRRGECLKLLRRLRLTRTHARLARRMLPLMEVIAVPSVRLNEQASDWSP